MNRRSFLSALSLSAAAIAVDPEMLGWRKSKTIFIPPAPKIVCDRLFGVDMEFTDDELLLSADDFRARYIEPAIAYYIAHDGLWELTGKETRLITFP